MQSAASRLAILAFLAPCIVPYAAANHVPAYDIRVMGPYAPFDLPGMDAWRSGATKVGCVGVAFVTLTTGTRVSLPGVALGEAACDAAHPPCLPYDGFRPTVVQDCVSNGAEPLYEAASPDQVNTELSSVRVCIGNVFLMVNSDLDETTPTGGDGYDQWIGPFPTLVDRDTHCPP